MLKKEYDDIIHEYYKMYYGKLMIKNDDDSLFNEFKTFLSTRVVPFLRNNMSLLNRVELEELRFIIANNFSVLALDKYPIIEKDVHAKRFVIISDTHFGSPKENVEYMKRVIDFCEERNIKNIFHAGDFVEGTYYEDPFSHYENREDLVNELYMAIDKYPKSNVTTHLVLGNHDINAYNNSFNIMSNNNNNRYLQAFKSNDKNIKLDGVGIVKYNLFDKNKKIFSFNIEHCIYNRFKTERPKDLIIHGHEHHYSAFYSKKKLSDLYIPPLCDLVRGNTKINSSKEIMLPGMLYAEIIGNIIIFIPYFFNNELREERSAMVYRNINF